MENGLQLPRKVGNGPRPPRKVVSELLPPNSTTGIEFIYYIYYGSLVSIQHFNSPLGPSIGPPDVPIHLGEHTGVS